MIERMKYTLVLMFLTVTLIMGLAPRMLSGCSTFKLQKGSVLIYGHNLNQGDIGVPGLIFINRRGVFKKGRTWDELVHKDRRNASTFCWISRYGSVTFNAFGRDFPDGGMNEVGLYIWEMNEDADYPRNDRLPKLDQMNWMQFVLDSYSTVDEAVRSASEVEIHGWGWHFFVGDRQGNCAAIAFVNGRVVVNRDESMPVPGLFNTPYDRELELLKYYRGFGGFYEPDLDDPKVPRFVKTAVLIRDYDLNLDPVRYGFKILDTLKVFDVPEWSVLFDAVNKDVYFKTRVNPDIKRFSFDQIDFSNGSGVRILNMDIKKGGEVLGQFSPYTNGKIRTFMKSFLIPILPEDFFTRGGLTVDGFIDRLSTHSDAAAQEKNQFFEGIWTGKSAKDKQEKKLILSLVSRKEVFSGTISISTERDESNEIEHLQLIGSRLSFTFKIKNKSFVEARALIEGNTMKLDLFGIEKNLGCYILERK